MPLLESMLLSLASVIFLICSVAFFLSLLPLEVPISTGVSYKLNNIDSNNGILISKNTILCYICYIYMLYIDIYRYIDMLYIDIFIYIYYIYITYIKFTEASHHNTLNITQNRWM